jgi:hypothetical protein
MVPHGHELPPALVDDPRPVVGQTEDRLHLRTGVVWQGHAVGRAELFVMGLVPRARQTPAVDAVARGPSPRRGRIRRSAPASAGCGGGRGPCRWSTVPRDRSPPLPARYGRYCCGSRPCRRRPPGSPRPGSPEGWGRYGLHRSGRGWGPRSACRIAARWSARESCSRNRPRPSRCGRVVHGCVRPRSSRTRSCRRSNQP